MMENGGEVKTMILAGDIGGTKTLLGLFDAVPARPRPVVVRSFGTLDYPDLPTMIAEFLTHDDAADARASHGAIESACFGVAGPVVDETVKVTNVPWFVDARRVATSLGIARVALLNDLEALAYAVPALRESETHVLQEGEALRGGNIGLIAAGTGLGQALLHNIDGHFVPSASEAGHADFAARTEREIALTRDLTGALRPRGRRACGVRPRAGQHPPRRPSRAVRGSGGSVVARCAPPPFRPPHWSGDAPAAWRRSTCSSRRTAPKSGNLALRAVSTGGLYHRRRDRAEDSAVADDRRLHARVPGEAAARPDAARHAGQGDPERRVGIARRRGLRGGSALIQHSLSLVLTHR